MLQDKYNLIVIVADTTRADCLGCYGNERVQTPELDRMASEGVVFENCYADGLPTIPGRRVYFTGKSILPMKTHGGWVPLTDDEVVIAEIAKQAGVTTGFFTDTYHYFRSGLANYHRGFDSWEVIRGQENDPWQSGPRNAFTPKDHIPENMYCENYERNMLQYLMNTQHIRTEDDYFCARTFNKAMTWLEKNYEQQFMLWIDTFDPHEPWDAPERFKKMYRDEYPLDRYLFGYGANASGATEEDYPVLRDLYAAEVSFVDMWVGRLLQRLNDLRLDRKTIIVFTSDHGTHIGEEGCLLKSASLLNSMVAQLPLIVRHPDESFAGKRIPQLVSAVDFAPTFLDFLGAKSSGTYTRERLPFYGLATDVEKELDFDGFNFWNLATGKKEKNHDRVFTEFGNFVSVRDDRWHYFQHTSGDNPGKGPRLYDLANDPGEQGNALAEHPDVAQKMRRYIKERLGYEIPNI